jgi:CelD/BcsL family acetyltransferase involved in cellulose biosynthesis
VPPPPATAPPDRRALYPDLGAVVHLDGAPDHLLDELPALYRSPYSTAEYFRAYDRPRRIYACELDEPRHVVAFSTRGATADVLNKVLDIEPAAVERVAAAIFRAHPEVRRIRAEVKFAPRELNLPAHQLYWADDQTLELPASPAAWEQRLGTSTRRHLPEYRNRLQRAHPDFRLETIEGAQIGLSLVEQVFAWNRQRVVAKGESYIYDEQPAAPHKLWRLLQSRGVALCGYLGDELVAGELLLHLGPDCWAQLGGFDPDCADLHLGFLMTTFCVSEAIRRGAARLHFGWGTVDYKQRLGAVPVRAYRIAVFRSRLDKALYAREEWRALVRDRKIYYWRARRRLKRRLMVPAAEAAPRRPRS